MTYAKTEIYSHIFMDQILVQKTPQTVHLGFLWVFNHDKETRILRSFIKLLESDLILVLISISFEN